MSEARQIRILLLDEAVRVTQILTSYYEKLLR
jgi:hypothetical protein